MSRALLDQACRDGIHSISVTVELRGEPVDLSADVFDLAEELPPSLTGKVQKAVQAAIWVDMLTPHQVRRLHSSRTQNAIRVLDAVALRDLTKRFRKARELVNRARGGDKSARQAVEDALKNPANLAWSCLLRDAIRECAEERQAEVIDADGTVTPVPPTEPAPAPEPEPAPVPEPAPLPRINVSVLKSEPLPS